METKYQAVDKKQLLYKLPDFNYNKPTDNPQNQERLQVWICGGAIRDSLVGEQYSDIDVFGLNKEDLDLFVSLNLTNAHGYKLVYFNENLRTYKKGKIKVQIVYREYTSMDDILDNFDFTVCQFSFDGEFVYCKPESLLDVYHKRIVINNINPLFVLDTVRRVQKYIGKGYTICNGGIKEILDKARSITQQEYEANIEFYPTTNEYRIIRFD